MWCCNGCNGNVHGGTGRSGCFRNCCWASRLNQAYLAGFQEGYGIGFREGADSDSGSSGCGSCCQWSRGQNADCGCCE